MSMRIIIPLVVLGGIIVTGLSSYFTVSETQQALVLQFGKPVRVVRDAGLHFKTPFVQDVVRIEKRILSLDNPPEELIAADQKRIVVDAFTRYRISDPLKFFQAVRNIPSAEARLTPAIESSMRSVLGEQKFNTVLSGERAVLMGKIQDEVNKRAIDLGLEIVDVRIKRADLPEANSEAVFRRMKTEREREAKEERARGEEEALRIRSTAERDRTVLLAEARKKSEILRGEGDGARAGIFNRAADKDPEFYSFYRSLQAYREALQSGDTRMILSPDSDFFRYFGDISTVDPSVKRSAE